MSIPSIDERLYDDSPLFTSGASRRPSAACDHHFNLIAIRDLMNQYSGQRDFWLQYDKLQDQFDKNPCSPNPPIPNSGAYLLLHMLKRPHADYFDLSPLMQNQRLQEAYRKAKVALQICKLQVTKKDPALFKALCDQVQKTYRLMQV